MSNGTLLKKDIDFGRTAKDYARHRAGFPESFLVRLTAENFLENADTVLDLGTGTGTVARGLARGGLKVTGVDPAQSLLEAAASLDRESGVHVSYCVGKAEATNLPEHAFDIVIAGQCWHWFEQEKALTEIQRLLQPQGKLIVAYFDWLPDAEPVDEMYKLQRKYNPAWKSGGWPLGFYPQRPEDLSLAGWRPVKSFLYTEDVPYTHEAWRGRMRAYAGIGGSLPSDTVEAFDTEFATILAKKFPQEVMMIPHKIWAGMWEMIGRACE